jgi:sec-independent protein translocase protein TatC
MAKTTDRQPFLAHIQELRLRLTWSALTLLAGTVIGYLLRDQLLLLLVAPLGQTLYYTSPGGGFSLIVQLCLGFGIVVAVPVLIFHLIRFLAPVLPNYSTKFLFIVLFSSCFLVSLGVVFAYTISLPAALYFLSEFSNEHVKALISTDTYMSFVTIYLAGFALLFQLPLILLIVNNITPLQPKKLLAHTRCVILISFDI